MAISDKMMTDGGYDVTPTPAPKAGTVTDASAFVKLKEAEAKASKGYNPLTGNITPSVPTGPTGPTVTTTGTSTATVTGTTTATTAAAPVTPAVDTGYANRVSAFNLLKDEFTKYGLGSLVDGIKGLIQENIPASELSLRLRETPAYQQRFSANADRIKNGLAALSPAEYVALEDQYQNVMRKYGLPSSYWAESVVDPKTGIKRQTGFDQLLAGDVSAVELEQRVQAAKDRVLNANPEVLQTLRNYYPGITNGDIMAYTLDPKNALKDIQRKVSAAEIGGAALAQGLTAGVTRAEELAGYGVTKEQAQQGYANVATMVPRGSQLAAIYGESPYGQSQAEAEVFGTAGAADAAAKRKKLTDLEKASFGGSSGVGALSRDRNFNPYGSAPGAGAY